MRQLSNIRHRCTLVVPIALVAIALTVLNLGRVRMSRVYFGYLEWTNGWPCVFLSRDVERAVPGGDPEALIPGPKLHWFRPAVAVVNALVALALIGAVSWAVRKRARSGRPLQYGLRGLLFIVTAVASLLGWELHHHRRQQQVVDTSADIYFGFYVDQRLPHSLRHERHKRRDRSIQTGATTLPGDTMRSGIESAESRPSTRP